MIDETTCAVLRVLTASLPATVKRFSSADVKLIERFFGGAELRLQLRRQRAPQWIAVLPVVCCGRWRSAYRSWLKLFGGFNRGDVLRLTGGGLFASASDDLQV